MVYNKAREEYKWKQWKEAEEKKMRELGVSEEVIVKLRAYDWDCFKKERTYLNWQVPDIEIVEQSEDVSGKWEISQPVTIQELLRAVDDREMREELIKIDAITLYIIY